MSKYDLVGVDGNAYSVMGYVSKALRREGLGDLVKEYKDKATSSDYNNLLCVSVEYVEKANEKAVENGYVDEEEDDLDDKVDQCDFDDLKDSVDGVCNEIKDIDKTIEGIQEELTKYVIENSKLRRAIKALANTPYLESVVGNILKGQKMASKVVDKWWFTTSGGHTIGIVKTYDETTKETKFRIGLGDGFNELIDAERIKSHGARFVPEVIK